MLSRIADALFWLNRYMERADGLLRVVGTHYILTLDKDVHGNLTWKPVLETFTTANEQEIASIENNTEASLKKLLIDTANHNSIKVIVSRARENARGVQDHITKEVWEEVNSVYHVVNQPSLEHRLSGYQALEVIDLFVKHSVLYTGVTDITMPRGIGWSFMNLGRYVERSFETLVLAKEKFEQIEYNLDEPHDIIQWRQLLLSLSGYELHLKTYRTNNYNKNVLHQVFFNEDFPHSVIYSLSRINRYLQDIVTDNHAADHSLLLRSFGRLYSKVKYTDWDSLNHQALETFLNEVHEGLVEFNTLLGQIFFSYS